MTFETAIELSMKRYDAAAAELRRCAAGSPNHESKEMLAAIVEQKSALEELARLKLTWSVAMQREKEHGRAARAT